MGCGARLAEHTTGDGTRVDTVPEMEQYFIGLAKARLAEAHIILSGK